jgi:hypothetical protein
MASDSPSDNKLVVRVEDGDELGAKLLALGNRLKPVDDENFFFFEIVRELVDAVLTNYRQLRQSYVDRDYPRLAWACRNLLELTIFLKYVLLSESNARRFADDRLVDGCEIIGALRALELHYDPASSVGPLDGLLTGMRSQMAAEGVTSTKHLEVRNLAETVGLKEDFAAINRVCSKLVHPTSWSVLAMNRGTNSFPDARELLFLYGVGYIAQVTIAVREHNAKQGMLPNR